MRDKEIGVATKMELAELKRRFGDAFRSVRLERQLTQRAMAIQYGLSQCVVLANWKPHLDFDLQEQRQRVRSFTKGECNLPGSP